MLRILDDVPKIVIYFLPIRLTGKFLSSYGTQVL